MKVQLKRLYCRYFQYSEELMEYILRMFNVYEAFNFLEMMEKPRPVTIRVNTLKARKREVA